MALPKTTNMLRPKKTATISTNGDVEESVCFWHWWMSGERPFFAADRPWERARFIVSGQALPGLADGEIAWADGPLTR